MARTRSCRTDACELGLGHCVSARSRTHVPRCTKRTRELRRRGVHRRGAPEYVNAPVHRPGYASVADTLVGGLHHRCTEITVALRRTNRRGVQDRINAQMDDLTKRAYRAYSGASARPLLNRAPTFPAWSTRASATPATSWCSATSPGSLPASVSARTGASDSRRASDARPPGRCSKGTRLVPASHAQPASGFATTSGGRESRDARGCIRHAPLAHPADAPRCPPRGRESRRMNDDGNAQQDPPPY
jgi:hypothetical protein